MSTPAAAKPCFIDRADHLRGDGDAIAALLRGDARLLSMAGMAPDFDAQDRLRWTALSDAPEGAELVFLGLDGERGCFAAVPAISDPVPMRAVRDLAARLHSDEFAVFACARSMADWHARHRFCAVCGAPTRIARGGWQRDCTDPACAATHYPRSDPVAIMTVEHRRPDGERVLLLGRQAGFPDGMYSALAGFVEPGETLEDAVAREIMEEAGVRVRDVTYRASQAWPFPSQLMLGCHAHADDDRITVDENELEDARWFTRAQIADARDGKASAGFSMPPAYAIAHRLICEWWERG
ncbi:NAD(+) diphosphatase [Croceicoccus sp. YJ47]|uniref:NAD(+) diphosphatase n=1 Tax=Croceicoccus sp. YJ47 TaxID=2798724 RepID=UPI001924B9A5|nr:NAD(+) diphosphatase [Croceicoccus sp. YJ47]QQN74512.1 NAD(+) diphosphatase [Croceicoccus sp. YJ47]